MKTLHPRSGEIWQSYPFPNQPFPSKSHVRILNFDGIRSEVSYHPLDNSHTRLTLPLWIFVTIFQPCETTPPASFFSKTSWLKRLSSYMKRIWLCKSTLPTQPPQS